MFFRAARVGCIACAIGLAFGALAQDKPADPPTAGDPQRAAAQPPSPLVWFSRSSAGWMANFSFADPVAEIQWSLAQGGPFESSGFLPVYDPQTRRPMANSAIELNSDAPVIYVRYADLQGNWVGPFAIPFDPAAEIVRFYRSILETTTGSWLAFRNSAPNILYYTHIASYRCAIREFRVGIDKEAPDRVVKLAPCDMRDPAGNPSNVDTHLWIDPSVDFASAQLVYQDGTVSETRIFRR